MNKASEELLKKYPFLQLRNAWTDEIIEDETWFDAIPEGWAKAFGMELIEEIDKLLTKSNYRDEYQIVQIKEKFGGLRWYDNGVPESIIQDFCDLIDKYEKISFRTCISCGKPAAGTTTSWILPYCNDCTDRELRPFKD